MTEETNTPQPSPEPPQPLWLAPTAAEEAADKYSNALLKQGLSLAEVNEARIADGFAPLAADMRNADQIEHDKAFGVREYNGSEYRVDLREAGADIANVTNKQAWNISQNSGAFLSAIGIAPSTGNPLMTRLMKAGSDVDGKTADEVSKVRDARRGELNRILGNEKATAYRELAKEALASVASSDLYKLFDRTGALEDAEVVVLLGNHALARREWARSRPR